MNMVERKLWVDILNENRNPAKGMVMRYMPPIVINGKVEVKIDEAHVESESQFWNNSFIMYVLGEDLSMHTVKNYTLKMWNHVQLSDMYFYDECYFILIFKSADEMTQL